MEPVYDNGNEKLHNNGGIKHDGAYAMEDDAVMPETSLHRQLKSRHISMISIGGVIGTGLFLGTGTALAQGGPVGLVLGYAVMGSITYAVMICLGEMIAYLPIAGGHIKMAERFVDPAFSFAMGWNYWYNWTIILPAELSAAAILINLWIPNTRISNALWISICLVVVIGINFLGAGVYGETEFWFASIKVLTITGLIILGIVLDLGGGPDHDRLGFRYWKNPGPFAQYLDIPGTTGRFLGFWSVLTQAAFSYIGTEIVAIAAGEAKNPRKNIPRAITRVYIRILLFYILGTFIISLLVPYNNQYLGTQSNAEASPFVIAINTAGIKALPTIVNACLLTSAWSAANSDLYTSSRALYGLAISRNAPSIFARTTRGGGLPYVSLLFCSLFGFLAYMGVSSGSNNVFQWFVNMTAVAGLMTWFGIGVTYLRFHAGMKAQGFDRRSLPFRGPLQPFMAWYVVCSTLIICFFSGWNVFVEGNWSTATFVTNYLPLVMFPILYIGYKFAARTRARRASEMDFKSDIAQIEADIEDDPPPRNFIEKFWAWLM